MSALAITTQPMAHQVAAVAKLLPSRVGALLMDMGTGKSLALLMLAAARAEKWDSLVWVTPCALRENVRRQIIEHTGERDILIWDGRALDAGIRPARIHIIGIETLSSSDRAVLALDAILTDRSFVAVDESITIKRGNAKRSHRITALAARCRYRAILTGTPLTQGLQDLYGQFRFLSPRILGYRTWWAFARVHLEMETRLDPMTGRERRTGRILSTQGEQMLADRIAPYVYQVRKDECLDLPDKAYQTRWCGMTTEQINAYAEAKREVLTLDFDDWSPIRIFWLFTALQSITCGFWTRADGSVTMLDETRTGLLCAVAAETSGHVVVWAKYRRAVTKIVARLSAEHGADAVHRYDGGMTSDEREASLSAWRRTGRFLVATQAVGGHGLTLVESSTAIFYADGFKYSERLQAEDRLHRIGQTRVPMNITLGCSGSIDERIQRSLAAKADTLATFQQRVQACRSRGMRDRAQALVRAL